METESISADPTKTNEKVITVAKQAVKEVNEEVEEEEEGKKEINAQLEVKPAEEPTSASYSSGKEETKKIEGPMSKELESSKEVVEHRTIGRLATDVKEHNQRLYDMEGRLEMIQSSLDKLLKKNMNPETSATMEPKVREDEHVRLHKEHLNTTIPVPKHEQELRLEETDVEVLHYGPASCEEDRQLREDKTVYVLLLKDGYFYVGSTNNLERRLSEHANGGHRSAKFVQLHPVEALIACYKGNVEVEDIVTIKLMLVFGWNRVRGGRWAWTSITGQPDILGELCALHPLLAATPTYEPCASFCFRCCKAGHVVANCAWNREESPKREVDSLAKQMASMSIMPVLNQNNEISFVNSSISKGKNCYVFVKVEPHGKILIKGIYDPVGELVVDIALTGAVERVEWGGRGQLEAVVLALKKLLKEDIMDTVAIVFRHTYPFTAINGTQRKEEHNLDLIEEGRKLKKRLESSGARIMFVCSENSDRTTTGSSRLDSLFKELT